MEGPYLSIYERVLLAGRTAKIYYYDGPSSTMEIVNLLRNQSKYSAPSISFGGLQVRKSAGLQLRRAHYNDHDSDSGAEIASDQHPDHHIQHGEIFINNVYNAIFNNEELWKTTALLIVYDEHGGIYDHVSPPDCTPDDAAFVASRTRPERARLSPLTPRCARPGILVSPWVPKNVVIPGPNQKMGASLTTLPSPPPYEVILRDFDPNTLSRPISRSFLQVPSESRLRTHFSTFSETRCNPTMTSQPL